MLKQVRIAAVKVIKPWVGESTWRALRQLDPSRTRTNRAIRAVHAPSLPVGPKRLLDAATTSDLPLERSVRALLSDLDALLTVKPRSRVAVLAGPRSQSIAEMVQMCYPGARLTTYLGELEDSRMHVQLAASGPYDLIIDAVADRADPVAIYRSVLFHLRRGGHLALASFQPDSTQRQRLWTLITRLVALRDPRSGTLSHDKDEELLAQATSRVVVGQQHLVVRNAITSRAKLREAEIGPLLQITGERVGTVLQEIEAECFVPRSIVRDHGLGSHVREQPPIESPALALREYNRVVCAPAQVVVKGNLLLPETYRHHLEPRLVNRATNEVSPRFAQVKRDLRNAEHLAGSYFHFDSEWPGHFGHVLSEQISRLWGWGGAKERHLDLRILLGRRPGHERALPFERAILASLGIPETDITLIDRPVRVERLLAATPMFSMPDYVSSRIAPIWDLVGRTVGPEAEDGAVPQRFFCGRERATRRCNNEADVERVFAEAGFEIVFPEHLPFATQVAMFQQADVVAGYAGSALFSLVFCAQPKRVLMLSSESYKANNEYLMAAVLGHEFDVFWSVADSRAPNSAFTFDFDREGRHLDRVLAELDAAN